MQLTRFAREDDAVSPVIGFDFAYSDGSSDTLEVSFEAGNPVDAERLALVVTGATDSTKNGRYEFAEASPTGFAQSGQFGAGSSVTLGATVASGIDLNSATVKVVWESQNTNPDAQRTSTVAVWSGPSA